MALSRNKGDDSITIRGVIIAVDWDDNGRVTAVAVSAHDEEEYVIERGEELLGFIREEVEITGVPIRTENQCTFIKVKKFKLLGGNEKATPSVTHGPA